MRSRSLMREVLLVERELSALELQGVLIEMMSNQVAARIIMAEQRKIARFALRSGIVEQSQLNEGLAADIVLGVGQAVGSIPGLNLSGVGAAFGAAGVLWYGKEMLNSSGFDFAMNLLFCLFSAAAIEPTGAGGEAGTLAKVLKPFAALGEWARNLGQLTFETATRAYKGLSTASQLLVRGATKAESPIMRGLAWVGEKIIPRVMQIFESIKGMVKGKPGAELFGKITERVVAGARGAFDIVRSGFEALVNLGKTALGQTAATEATAAAKAAEATTASAFARTGEAAGAQLAAVRQSAAGIDRLLSNKAAGPLKTYMATKGINSAELLSRIANGDVQAIKVINQATNKTKLPEYIQAGVDAYKGATASLSRASMEASQASIAQGVAQQAARDAAKTAAARTAAAKAGAARLGASAIKTAGNMMNPAPEDQYNPGV